MKRAIVGQFASILGAIPVSRPQDNAVSCAGTDPIRTLGVAWLGLWSVVDGYTAGTLSVVNGEYRVVGVGTRFTALEEKATLLLPGRWVGILAVSTLETNAQNRASCSATYQQSPDRIAIGCGWHSTAACRRYALPIRFDRQPLGWEVYRFLLLACIGRCRDKIGSTVADGVEVVIACLISDIVLTIEKAWEHGTLRNTKFQMLPRVDQREVYREAIPPSLHAACCMAYVACHMFHVPFLDVACSAMPRLAHIWAIAAVSAALP